MNVPPDFSMQPDSDPFSDSLPTYIPKEGDSALGSAGLIDELSSHIAKQLAELQGARKAELEQLGQQMNLVALDCARALDDLDNRVQVLEGSIEKSEAMEKLNGLRERVYSQLAEHLQKARESDPGVISLPLN